MRIHYHASRRVEAAELIHDAIAEYRRGGLGALMVWHAAHVAHRRNLLAIVNAAMGSTWRWAHNPADRFERFVMACSDGMSLDDPCYRPIAVQRCRRRVSDNPAARA